MGTCAHLLEGKLCLPDGASCAMGDVLPDDGEGLPQGIGLEG